MTPEKDASSHLPRRKKKHHHLICLCESREDPAVTGEPQLLGCVDRGNPRAFSAPDPERPIDHVKEDAGTAVTSHIPCTRAPDLPSANTGKAHASHHAPLHASRSAGGFRGNADTTKTDPKHKRPEFGRRRRLADQTQPHHFQIHDRRQQRKLRWMPTWKKLIRRRPQPHRSMSTNAQRPSYDS
jgi:hypothetical protein